MIFSISVTDYIVIDGKIKFSPEFCKELTNFFEIFFCQPLGKGSYIDPERVSNFRNMFLFSVGIPYQQCYYGSRIVEIMVKSYKTRLDLDCVNFNIDTNTLIVEMNCLLLLQNLYKNVRLKNKSISNYISIFYNIEMMEIDVNSRKINVSYRGDYVQK